MKNICKKTQRLIKKAAMFLLLTIAMFLLAFLPNGQGMYAVKADGFWYGEPNDDDISIERFFAEYTVNADRSVDVVEHISVMFLQDDLSMFYRSLPKEHTRYSNIQAKCEPNPDFSYYVEDNPDFSEFLDINCVGGAQKGNYWEYTISYTMEHFKETRENGMIIDLVGFGSSVAVNDVFIIVNFPENSRLQYEVFSGDYSAMGNNANVTVSQPSSTQLILKTDRLERIYQDYYGEWMAEGITLSFSVGEGVLQSVASMQFTSDFIYILLACLGGLGVAVLAAILLPKRREIITSVNVRAPEDMDPMTMGKLLDNVVDNEDVTSMIYYFAHKGYLHIDLTDEDDPLLIQKVPALPNSESAHARTLFNGLFAHADRKVIAGETPFDEDTVEVTTRISALKNRFYESVATAKEQVVKTNPYDKKSIIFYVLGGIIGWAIAILVPFVMSVTKIGGAYTYLGGVSYGVIIAIILLLGFVRENYRYKWKAKGKAAMLAAQIALAVLFSLLYTLVIETHVMTTAERVVMSVAAFACTFLTMGKLTRTEKYCERLGDILGFKEFILYTEEDKIKFMLEENPQLFYKVLPYAQVLGVTNEWEDKFASITLEPPTWCSSTHMTYLDYVLIRSCMRSAMLTAMTPPQAKGGSFVGRGGGGGSFGGFGGGGFGGGGFGAR